MSITLEKTIAAIASNRGENSSDGMILLIAALTLVAMIGAFALAPVAPDNDISGALTLFGV